MAENPLYSFLSTSARSRAILAKKRRDSGKGSRRHTVIGSIDGFLSEHVRQDLLDEGSLCSQQSEHSKLSVASTGMRYQRRCSITQFSLDPSLTSESNTVSLEEDDFSFSSFQTSERSFSSFSSFPEVPIERTTIDDLPIPMKKSASNKKERSSRRLQGSKKSKSRDSITKYTQELLNEDDQVKSASFKKKKSKKTTSSGRKDSESKKKDKSDKKGRSEKKSKSGKALKVEGSEPTDSEAPSRKHQRRCSVTKYNLLPKMEAEMETDLSRAPPSHGMMGRRNSVTKYSPDVMDSVEKSPGLYRRRNSVTKYSAELNPNLASFPVAACV